MAISALLCLHWDQVADPAHWAELLRLRARRLPGRYLAGVLAGVVGLITAPTPKKPGAVPATPAKPAGPAFNAPPHG